MTHATECRIFDIGFALSTIEVQINNRYPSKDVQKRHEKRNFRDILAIFHEMFTVSTSAYTCNTQYIASIWE